MLGDFGVHACIKPRWLSIDLRTLDLVANTHGFLARAITALFVGTNSVMFEFTFTNKRLSSSSLAYEKKMEVPGSMVRRSKSVGRTLEAGRLSSIGTLGRTIWSAAAAAWRPMVTEISGRMNVAKSFIADRGWGQSVTVQLWPDVKATYPARTRYFYLAWLYAWLYVLQHCCGVTDIDVRYCLRSRMARGHSQPM